MNNKTFISVDWGTTNLRIRLVETPTLLIIEEIVSAKGVKTVHDEWLDYGGNKENFFLNFLEGQIQRFKSDINLSTQVVISGMASSSIGIRELPYANLPFNVSGEELYVEQFKNSNFPYPINIISGVKSESDVIRGEEVEIIGLVEGADANQTTIFITPGTHSKHILCEKNIITDFSTYMTGEMFSVISDFTILKNSIEKNNFSKDILSSFEQGVADAAEGKSLLNSLFKTRTNILFEQKTKQENYYYLSGLLIGEELQTLFKFDCDNIKLCAGGKLFELYYKAIEVLGLLSKTKIVSKELVDKSVVKGQWSILKNKIEK